MDPSDDDLDDSTTPAQHDRTAQSDADFEAQRQAYTAKHDTGDVRDTRRRLKKHSPSPLRETCHVLIRGMARQ